MYDKIENFRLNNTQALENATTTLPTKVEIKKKTLKDYPVQKRKYDLAKCWREPYTKIE